MSQLKKEVDATYRKRVGRILGAFGGLVYGIGGTANYIYQTFHHTHSDWVFGNPSFLEMTQNYDWAGVSFFNKVGYILSIPAGSALMGYEQMRRMISEENGSGLEVCVLLGVNLVMCTALGWVAGGGLRREKHV